MDLEARYKAEEKKNRNRSLIGTLISFGLIVAVLVSLGLYYQIPPPEEESLGVIFGNPDGGSSSEYVKDPVTAPNTPSSSDPEQTLTQDYEKAPSLRDNDSKNPTDQENNSTENTRKKGFSKDGREGGSGDNQNEGNKGQPDGGETGEDEGGGSGGGGNGLGSRVVSKKPSGKGNCTEKGIVRVEIVVSPKGTVIQAKFVLAESTVTDQTCVKEALALARQYVYEPVPESKGNSVGIIKIELR